VIGERELEAPLTRLGVGFVGFIAEYVAQIPVPGQTNHQSIERIVNKILGAKKSDPSADVSDLERD
jgi:hypothetical protein